MTATATATRRARPASTSKNRKKRKKKSRRSWRRKALALIVIAVIVALLAGGLWVVYYSPALVTKRVNVVGTRNLTPVQVSLTAQVPARRAVGPSGPGCDCRAADHRAVH